MKNVLITGANGQLGKALNISSKNLKEFEFFFTDVDELDITSKAQLKEFIQKKKIKIIINCAAYTAVDKAETDRERAFQINVDAVKNLAVLAAEFDISLIHISTDYVFDGTSSLPYTELDKANPSSYYGLTKYQAELKIEQFANNAIILRTSWLYSEFGNNFVKTMLKLGYERDSLNIINDQFGSPTYASDLAEAILTIIQNKVKGVSIFNYSNEGSCSWFEFAKTIFEIKNIDCLTNPITTKEYPTAAARPKYSLLDKTKISKAFKITVPHWKDSLTLCLNNL